MTKGSAKGNSLFDYGICVKECPDSTTFNVECSPACPSTMEVYETYYLFSYCAFTYDDLPQSAKDHWDDLTESFTNSYYGSGFADLYTARWTILASPLVAVIFTFAYIYFMDKCAYYLSWFSVALIQFALIGLGVYTYMWRSDILADLKDDDEEASNLAYTLNWVTWISWILAAIYYLVMACSFKSLRVAIAVIETAADYFSDTKRVIFVPVLFFFVGIIVFIGWVVAVICVGSIGEIEVNSVAYQSKDIEWSDATYYMMYFMVFGIVWLLAFIISLNEFVIVVSAVTWYYSDKTIEDDDGIPGDSDVSYGFKWAFKYHLGSIALGSFALALIWIIRAIFEYVGKKIQDASGNNGLTKCLVGCIRCCLACFDRFIRFLNRNAYIYIAITSESFCASALDAFIMVLKNSLKFAFVDGIADVFMFLAKFMIATLTTFTSYWILVGMTSGIESAFLPLAVVFGLTWVISSVFIAIFDTGSNTILQCYLLDKEIASYDNLEDPDHIPPTMAKFFQSETVKGIMAQSKGDAAREPLVQGNTMDA